MYCYRCGNEVGKHARICAHCGADLKVSSAQVPTMTTKRQTASAMNRPNEARRVEAQAQRAKVKARAQNGYIPDNVKRYHRKWSWGAFVFAWIWGVFNGVYISFLTLIPLFGLLFRFVLGVKGHEWAWEARAWHDEEHYISTMKRWDLAGLITAILVVVVIVMGVALYTEDTIVNTSAFDVTSEDVTYEVPIQESDAESFYSWGSNFDNLSPEDEDILYSAYTTEGFPVMGIVEVFFTDASYELYTYSEGDATIVIDGDITYLDVPTHAMLTFYAYDGWDYDCIDVAFDDDYLSDDEREMFLNDLYDTYYDLYPEDVIYGPVE